MHSIKSLKIKEGLLHERIGLRLQKELDNLKSQGKKFISDDEIDTLIEEATQSELSDPAENQNPDIIASHLLSGANLFYPSAKEWMWHYCVYLGPFTDSEGDNYDLGIFMGHGADRGCSAAIVYGDTPGNYLSGSFDVFGKDSECYQETLRRAKEIGLIKI